ncbi:hypothetical protein evm_011708 [Chilo suppressalis]|nr:hypothetical protein evm_011708 [Chilo suppressalis]
MTADVHEFGVARHMNNDFKPSNNVAVPTRTSQLPCAHISFVYGADGEYKPLIKRKRNRRAFTTSQIAVLEEQFLKRPYVSPQERQFLCNKLQISDKIIKVWFQNRRTKEKREKQESSSSQSPDSQLNNVQMTDYENSNVDDIFDDIDDFMSKDLNVIT